MAASRRSGFSLHRWGGAHSQPAFLKEQIQESTAIYWAIPTFHTNVFHPEARHHVEARQVATTETQSTQKILLNRTEELQTSRDIQKNGNYTVNLFVRLDFRICERIAERKWIYLRFRSAFLGTSLLAGREVVCCATEKQAGQGAGAMGEHLMECWECEQGDVGVERTFQQAERL